MLKTLLTLSFILLFTNCTTNRVQTKSTISTQQQNKITKALYKEYKKWNNVPYKYGGTSLKGVDCSSLMQIVYKDAFSLKIPRTTKNQAKIGHKVSKNSSKEGDLVFFKTKYKTRHSGIIIEGGKFMHTSTKNGVMISDMNNPYWKSKYWQTRRVLP